MPLDTSPKGSPIPYKEFVAVCALTIAVALLGVDIMISGILLIGEDFGVGDENSRQWLISAYLIPFGIGQLFFGNLSDSFGRKPIILIGLLIYALASLASPFAPDYQSLLILRITAGIAASAGRVAVVAMVRDCFSGRHMASIMSTVMMVVMVIPIVAPALGQFILFLSTWPFIFYFMTAFSMMMFAWIYFRLPETIANENRRELRVTNIVRSFKAVLNTRLSLGYSIALSIFFGCMFGYVNSSAQIFLQLYDLGPYFPIAFSFGGVVIAITSMMNSYLVQTVGMRRLAHGAVLFFIINTAILLALAIYWDGKPPIVIFVIGMGAMFGMYGFVGTNYNAMAMEPLGREAGTASAIFGFVQSSLAGLIGAIIGQLYDGTTIPLILGSLVCGLICLALTFWADKGKFMHVDEGYS